ncbi:MAG: hypothetical protein IT424_04005 [Pirellulales bacterium]|nr:hypothetical protein [Pirellulales bacterium]
MASTMARGGRRRRILNEELLSGANLAVARPVGPSADEPAPRYGEQAGIEHHPQVSDFVPRRTRTVLLMLAAGIAAAAACQSLVRYAEPIAAAVPGLSAEALVQLADSVVAWLSAIGLLAAALLARLVYSLRKHRVDDLQGRYRVWKWVAWAAALGSLNAVADLQRLFAAALAGATGWSLTSSGAEWWLAPLGVAGAWLLARTSVELRECRTAWALTIAAGAWYAAAAVGALGGAAATLGAWNDALSRTAPLVGHAFTLAALMKFARYVVLDVQGLIDHSPRRLRRAKHQRPTGAPAAEEPAAAATVPMPTPKELRSAPTLPTPIPMEAAASTGASWDADDDEEQSQLDSYPRKPSKAERKRLRKQNRAA